MCLSGCNDVNQIGRNCSLYISMVWLMREMNGALYLFEMDSNVGGYHIHVGS